MCSYIAKLEEASELAQELRTNPDVISRESFKEFISEIPGINRALLDVRTKGLDDLHATQRMIVTQFIHVAFGTRGSDTTRKYTAHEVDDLADVRQLLDVLGEKVQDVDPEFEMQSLQNIMDGSSMIWLQDTSKGTTSADGAQIIQRTLHVLPHSHYPGDIKCQAHHHHSKCNMGTPKGTSCPSGWKPAD